MILKIEDLQIPLDLIPDNLKSLFHGLDRNTFILSSDFDYGQEKFFCNHLIIDGLNIDKELDLVNAYLGGSSTFDSRFDHVFIVDTYENASYHTYHLNNDILSSLKLTPRLIGNQDQNIFYDDWSLPENNIIEGKSSFSSFDVINFSHHWKMKTNYLLNYLGQEKNLIRMFFYQNEVECNEYWNTFLDGEKYKKINALDFNHEYKLFEMEIEKKENNRILIRLWCNYLLKKPAIKLDSFNKYNLSWNGKQYTKKEIESTIHNVYIKDSFLEKYQRQKKINTTPHYHKDIRKFYCSPSLNNQWHITECEYISKNIIMLPIKELYINNNDIINHIHSHQINNIDSIIKDKKHNLFYVFKFINEIIQLNENLKLFCNLDSYPLPFCRETYEYSGLDNENSLLKLTHIIPEDMSEDLCLSKFKVLFEILNKLSLKNIKLYIRNEGSINKSSLNDNVGFLKILEILAEYLTSGNWKIKPEKNSQLSSLNTLNLLRNLDGHLIDNDSERGLLGIMSHIGYDSALLDNGYNDLYYHIIKEVLKSLAYLNNLFFEELKTERKDIIDFEKYLDE